MLRAVMKVKPGEGDLAQVRERKGLTQAAETVKYKGKGAGERLPTWLVAGHSGPGFRAFA